MTGIRGREPGLVKMKNNHLDKDIVPTPDPCDPIPARRLRRFFLLFKGRIFGWRRDQRSHHPIR
jgi:hypothetical protein